MYTLKKTFRFEASHQLKDHEGKCACLHGHSWVVKVELKGNHLQTNGPERGMLIDYGNISEPVRHLLNEQLDHAHLNDILECPTSEFLATWIYTKLNGAIPHLSAVEVEETDGSWCRYEP